MQEINLRVKSTELVHCNVKEGKENQYAHFLCNVRCS